MEPISKENNLPNTCNKPEASMLGAKRVSEKEHEEIMEEIARRAALEHDEILENECDSDSHSYSSSDHSDSDSDDKSGTDNK
jgi:DNA-directed RNA polymerase specialized sigma subunit